MVLIIYTKHTFTCKPYVYCVNILYTPLPVAKISNAGEDVEPLVDLRVDGAGHDLDVRKGVGNGVNSFTKIHGQER